MDSNPIDYWLVFFIGMIAVAIHARTLYLQPAQERDADRHESLVGSLSVSMLSGRGYFYRGFLFYLLISELVYVVLALSSGILLLSLTVLGRSDLAGAISGGVEFNPMIPLGASTAYIAATQVKPVAMVELAFRRMAHSLAGIPDTIYDVQKRIGDSLAAVVKAERELQSETHEFVTTDGREPSTVEYAVRRARFAANDMPVPELFDKKEREEVQASIERVCCLHAWTLGVQGKRLWIGDEIEQILHLTGAASDDEAFRTLDVQLDQKDASVNADGVAGKPSIGKSAHDPDLQRSPRQSDAVVRKRWEEISKSSARLERKLKLVLALLFLNKPDAGLVESLTLDKVRRAAMARPRNTVIDAHLVSLFVGFTVSVLVISLYLGAKDRLKSEIRWQVDPQRLAPRYEHNAEPVSTSAIIRSEIAGSDGIAEKTRQSIDAALINSARNWGSYLHVASWEVFNYFIVFGLSTITAIAMIRIRKRENRWRLRRFQRGRPPPFMTYVSIGLIGYILVTATYLSVNFFALAVMNAYETGVPTFSSINLSAFRTELPRLLLFPLAAIVFAWFICVQYDRRRAERLFPPRALSAKDDPLPGRDGAGSSFRKRFSDVLATAPIRLRTWHWKIDAFLYVHVSRLAQAFACVFLAIVAGAMFLGITESVIAETRMERSGSGWTLFGYWPLLGSLSLRLSLLSACLWAFVLLLPRAKPGSGQVALKIGALVGLVNLALASVLGRIENGWAILDASLMPSLCFSVFAFSFLVRDPLIFLDEETPGGGATRDTTSEDSRPGSSQTRSGDSGVDRNGFERADEKSPEEEIG